MASFFPWLVERKKSEKTHILTFSTKKNSVMLLPIRLCVEKLTILFLFFSKFSRYIASIFYFYFMFKIQQYFQGSTKWKIVHSAAVLNSLVFFKVTVWTPFFGSLAIFGISLWYKKYYYWYHFLDGWTLEKFSPDPCFIYWIPTLGWSTISKFFI